MKQPDYFDHQRHHEFFGTKCRKDCPYRAMHADQYGLEVRVPATVSILESLIWLVATIFMLAGIVWAFWLSKGPS